MIGKRINPIIQLKWNAIWDNNSKKGREREERVKYLPAEKSGTQCQQNVMIMKRDKFMLKTSSGDSLGVSESFWKDNRARARR